jgi:cell division protein FtsQ
VSARGSAPPPAPVRARPPMDDRIRERRRAVVRQGARRRRRIAGSLAALILLVGGAYAITHSPLFAVDEVRVTGAEGARAELVRELAAVVPGERLLSVDLDAVGGRVGALPWVRSVEVSRLPPSTVQVAITPRMPVVTLEVSGGTWLVDEEGVVVAAGDRTDLPLLEAPNSVVPRPGGVVSDAAVRNALQVHLLLPGPRRATVLRYDAPSDRGLRVLIDAGADPAGGDGLPEGHSGETVDGVWVRFGTAERVPEKAQVIDLLLAQAREQAEQRRAEGEGGTGIGVAELDVRAPDNPVLVPRP